jgi:4'-phosphopantetheinyl transferase
VVQVRWSEPHAGDEPAAHLDRTERARLAGLRRLEDRARFVTSRALLKELVGALCDVPAADVRLDYRCDQCGTAHGRPTVAGPRAAQGWRVSLAHAGDRVVVAASRDGAVGVDVEPVSAVGFAGFADVALTVAEAELLAAARTDAARARLGTQLWTRKEAALKARGVGLTVDPRTVDAVTGPKGLTVTDLDVGTGYGAAVAVLVEGKVGSAVRCNQASSRSLTSP